MAPVTFGLSSGLDCGTVEPCLEPVHHSRSSSFAFFMRCQLKLNDKIWRVFKIWEPFKSFKNAMSAHFKAEVIGLDPACRWRSLKLQTCVGSSPPFILPLSTFLSLQNLKIEFFPPPDFSSSEVLVSVFERWLDLRNKENKFTLFRGQLSSSRSLWSKNIRHILRIGGVNKCLQADLSLYLCSDVDGRGALFNFKNSQMKSKLILLHGENEF